SSSSYDRLRRGVQGRLASRPRHGNHGADFQTLSRSGFQAEFSVQSLYAFAQSHQTEPRCLALACFESLTVVRHAQVYRVALAPDLHLRTVSAGVSQHVGQAFLHQTVSGDVDGFTKVPQIPDQPQLAYDSRMALAPGVDHLLDGIKQTEIVQRTGSQLPDDA